jgi:hypothetical protein
MLGRFPHLSKVATKILEIAGAGCASALAAVLLGNAREGVHPPAPPQVVRLAPADEQMIRFVRDEGVALVEQLRTASDGRSSPAAVSPAAVSPAPLAASPAPAAAAKPKAASANPARRDQKPNRAQTADTKQRPSDPPQAQATASGTEPPRVLAGTPAAADTNDARTSPVVAASEWAPSSTPTQVPSRLWPAAVSSVRDAPRPPLAVGEARAM